MTQPPLFGIPGGNLSSDELARLLLARPQRGTESHLDFRHEFSTGHHVPVNRPSYRGGLYLDSLRQQPGAGEPTPLGVNRVVERNAKTLEFPKVWLLDPGGSGPISIERPGGGPRPATSRGHDSASYAGDRHLLGNIPGVSGHVHISAETPESRVVTEFARCTRMFEEMSAAGAATYWYHLNSFIGWIHRMYDLQHGLAEMSPALGHHEVVDEFVRLSIRTLAPSTLHVRHSVLHRCAAVIARLYPVDYQDYGMEDPQPAPEPVTRIRRHQPPYTADELNQIMDWVGCRPTAYSRCEAATMVTLALGAGISPVEMLHLKFSDLTVTDHIVEVDAPGHARISARTVPVTSPYDQILVAATAALTPPEHLVRRGSQVRDGESMRRAVSDFAKITTRSCPGGLKPRFSRLRQTWIINHIAHRVPSAALRTAAGINTFKDHRKIAVATGVIGEQEFTAWHCITPRDNPAPDQAPLTTA